MTPVHFRHSYEEARSAGFDGSRAEFCRLILGAPYLFRGALVAAAKAWSEERGQAPARPIRKVAGARGNLRGV